MSSEPDPASSAPTDADVSGTAGSLPDAVETLVAALGERSTLAVSRAKRIRSIVRAFDRHTGGFGDQVVAAAGVAGAGLGTLDEDMLERHLTGGPLSSGDLVQLDAVPAATRRLLEGSIPDPEVIELAMEAFPLDPYAAGEPAPSEGSALIRIAGCIDLLERRGVQPADVPAELRRCEHLDQEIAGDLLERVYLPGKELMADVGPIDEIDFTDSDVDTEAAEAGHGPNNTIDLG